MSINLSQRASFATELRTTLTMGGNDLVGTLIGDAIIIIFDNQSTSSTTISLTSGGPTWKTFTAGEALVLDMRANHGIAPNMFVPGGTSFFATGTAGQAFSISYITAKQP